MTKKQFEQLKDGQGGGRMTIYLVRYGDKFQQAVFFSKEKAVEYAKEFENGHPYWEVVEFSQTSVVESQNWLLTNFKVQER